MSQSKPRAFAYDQNCKDGFECPALAAGFCPEDNDLMHIVEAYDEEARYLSHEEWLIGRKRAKEAWEKAIEQVRDDIEELEEMDADPAGRLESRRRGVEVAERILNKVF